jgi:dihydroxyacetone kinase-like predicted kinase
MKYDKMVEITQAESQRKMDVAKKAISGMLDNMERITVAELVRRTRLSRGFFYKNPMVRRELDDAIHRQEAIFKNQHPVIMDKELEDTMVDLRIELLRAKTKNEELAEQNQQLSEHNEKLYKEIETLKKQLGRKEVSLLKRL